MERIIPTENAMLEFGAKLAKSCLTSATIFLYGNLGAGKTTLVRGFLRGLDYEGSVKSPTYTIVEPYSFKDFNIYHFDLYRVRDVRELEYIGIQDYFTPDAICLIEWPENGAGFLPPADLSCYIELQGTGRVLEIDAQTPCGQDILKRLQDEQ